MNGFCHRDTETRRDRAIFYILSSLCLCASLSCEPSLATTQAGAPPLGKYAVYLFDPYGNAEYAFDFELLTASEKGKPGRYELQMGKTPKGEKEKWTGEYEYDGSARRLRWLNGPFERSDLYRQDAKNPEGGKVVEKNGRWTIFLNNKARGTSVPKSSTGRSGANR